MEATKKRKRDEGEVDYPRITYDTSTRTFDRLFKEDNLEGMKAVVRKKLGVSATIPIFLSQIRDGKPVDLEDDDDFEAFCAAARSTYAAKVKVAVGADPVIEEPVQREDQQSTSKKKSRRRKSDASLVPARSDDLEGPSNPEPPPSKKRRVSFLEPAVEQEPDDVMPLETPKKKSKHSVTDSSTEAVKTTKATKDVPSRNGISSSEGKKKKKKEQVVDDDSSASPVPQQEARVSTEETSRSKGLEASATKKSRKRLRDEDVEEEQTVTKSITKKSSKSHLASKDAEEVLPSKKSKKKNSDTVDNPPPVSKKSSRPKSVPPAASDDSSSADITTTSPPEIVELVTPSAKKKKDKAASEPPSGAAVNEVGDTTTEKKKKTSKSKVNADVDDQLVNKSSKSTSKTKDKKKESPTASKAMPADGSDTETVKKTKTSEKVKAVKHVPATSSEEGLERVTSTTAESRTPKKSHRKSEAGDKELSSKLQENPGVHQSSPLDKEEQRVAMLAAVQAVLARKGGPLPAAPVAAPPVPEPPQNGARATPAPAEKTPAIPSSRPPVSRKGKEQPDPSSVCPVCNESPTHARTKCPIIKSGIRSMRARIAVLEKDTSGDQDERNKIIEELQTIIDKKSRAGKTTTGAAAKGKAKANPAAAQENATQDDTQASSAKAIEAVPEKQVDVVVSPPVRVVDVVPPVPPPTQPARSILKTIAQSSSQPAASKPSPNHTAAPKQTSPPQPISLVQKDAQKKARSSAAVSKKVIKRPAPPGMSMLGVGDLSQVTEQDLHAIMFGPKLSIKDMPSSSSEEEEDEQEENVLLEDDDEDDRKMTPSRRQVQNTSRAVYSSSSDGEDDDDDNDAPFLKSARESGEVPIVASRSTSQDPLLQPGNLSFNDMDTRGSSREMDRTGNDAVDEALAHDLSPFHIPEPPPILRQRATDVDSDTAVASQGEDGDEGEQDVESTESVAAIEVPRPDSIEPSDNGPVEMDQPDPIVSDNEVLSTPKAEVAVRRSQRGKTTLAKASEGLGESQVSQEDGVSDKATKKTRGMMRISDIPILPNPSVRIIKASPAMGSRTRSQKGASQEDTGAAASELDNGPATTTKGKRTAKPLAKEKKTPAKSVSKVAETPNMKPATAKIAAKATPAPRARAGADTTPVEPTEDLVNTATESTDDVPSSQWVVLPESHSTETPGQFDELMSSVQTNRSENIERAAPSSPLFLHSETQQSFPYSQYPGILGSQRTELREVSPHDSEDENEVEAAVVQPVIRQPRFRALSQMSSQGFSTPTFQKVNLLSKAAEIDLYGGGSLAEKSDESQSDTDSDSEEEKPLTSHFPAARRAGVAAAKQK